MAIVATVFGGFFGTVSALIALFLFGTGFWTAVGVYFAVSAGLGIALFAAAMLNGGIQSASDNRKSAQLELSGQA